MWKRSHELFIKLGKKWAKVSCTIAQLGGPKSWEIWVHVSGCGLAPLSITEQNSSARNPTRPAMASAASLSLWRGRVITRWGSSVTGSSRRHPHRRFYLAVSANKRNAEEERTRAVKIDFEPRKANELASDRLFNYVLAHTREPEACNCMPCFLLLIEVLEFAVW